MKRKLLTKEQKEYIFKNYQNKPYIEIAQELNCTINQVGLLITRSGLNKDRKNVKCKRKYKVNEKYFDKIDNDKKAYILGFILADGCITNGRLIITLSKKDLCVLDFIKKELEYNGPITEKTIINKSGKKSDMVSLSINSVYVVNSLLKLNINYRKTYLSDVPIVSDKFTGSFLRGYFDGDGYVGFSLKYKLIVFAAQNKKFLENVREKCGLNNIGIIYKKGLYYAWTISRLKDIYNLFNFMYKNNDFCLQRKFVVFLNIFAFFKDKYDITNNKFKKNRKIYKKKILI